MSWNPKENWSGNQFSPLNGNRSYFAGSFPAQNGFQISPEETTSYDNGSAFNQFQSMPANPSSENPLPPQETEIVSARSPSIAEWMRRDPLVTIVVIISVLIMGYQLTVMTLRPPWLGAATDWGRASLAWVELIPVLLAGVVLYRSRRPGAISWLMFAAAMLSYSIAQATWAILNNIVEPGHAPIPSLADLFYLLQYPFFFLALALLPGVLRQGRLGIARAKIVLDSLLLMAAGTALSWYFILAPFYMQSMQNPLGKATNLAYPVGDLGLLFGLTVVIVSQNQRQAGRIALRILIAAVVFLILADSAFLYEQLYGSYAPGDLPDAFWVASYLLFALAGLVRFRTAQRETSSTDALQTSEQEQREPVQVNSMASSFQSLLPFLAAVLSSVLIIFRATTAPTTAIGDKNPVIPFAVSLGLLVLVGARQGITVLENGRLLRDEQRRTEELIQARQIAEEQRRLFSERNQRLEGDIEILKDVHAQVARGDYSARVPITSGELLPIAGSLNIMLDRLTNLIRASSEYVRLDQAMRLVVAAAQGLAAGDERALADLATPTNTPLDGVTIALRQLRARIVDLWTGLSQLEPARKAAQELAEIMTQQNQFITNEGMVLNRGAGALNQLAAELERIIQILERPSSMSLPSGRSMTQLTGLLQMLLAVVRQQIAEVEAQMLRFTQSEQLARIATSGSRRLAIVLDATARSGGSQITTDGTGSDTPAPSGKAMPRSSSKSPLRPPMRPKSGDFARQ